MTLPTKYDKRTLRLMFDGVNVSPILPYESLDGNRELVLKIAEGNGRISLSGVQPKYAMVIDGNHLRFTNAGERGRYILKPAPISSFILDKQYCPENEYITMHIASEVYHIQTAANCLCFFENGAAAYLTRRFDMDAAGNKYQQEDFASVASVSKTTHGEDYKYTALSYEECAPLLDKYCASAMVEKLKFFRLVLFNYLCLNDDAHLKNFSLIAYRTNDYVLAPAYDLMNTSLHLATPQIFALTKGLFKEGMSKSDTYSIDRGVFLRFGINMGLPELLIQKEIDNFSKEYPQVEKLISSSNLPVSMKEHYFKSFNYRRQTLI